MRALVTGAAGFVGSNLSLELQRGGHEVVALDDFSVGSFENLREFKGDVVAADLAEGGEWQGKVGKIDSVFHQAACTDTTIVDQKFMMRANVEAFRTLLEWSAKTGVKTVVYASSAGVYGDRPVPQRETDQPRPLNVYAFSKMVMESVARDFQKKHPSMSVVGLRYFNVFGPREKHKNKAASMIWQLSQQMLAGKRPRIFEFGEQYRDFIYVKDVVRANLLAAEKAKEGVFNICTGKKATFNQMVESLNATLGTALEAEYFKNPYGFYQNETLGETKAASLVFGFKAEFDLGSGIEDYFKGPKVAAGV